MVIVSFVLQALLILLFFMSGLRKVRGTKDSRDEFDHLGLPQWFRSVAGVVELLAVVALIIGYWSGASAAIGALMIGAIALGGIVAMVRIKEPLKTQLVIIVAGLLAAVIVVIHAGELLDLVGSMAVALGISQ